MSYPTESHAHDSDYNPYAGELQHISSRPSTLSAINSAVKFFLKSLVLFFVSVKLWISVV